MPMNEQHIRLLKDHKLSLTSVRLAVLEAIENHPHSDADTIFTAVRESIGTTSKQAIYHNLATLVSHGIIREIKPKGRPSLYEARIDDNHHHIVCRSCGVIMDTICIADARSCLTPAEDHGFVIDEAEITFWGLCPACQTTSDEQGEEHE